MVAYAGVVLIGVGLVTWSWSPGALGLIMLAVDYWAFSSGRW